MTDGFIQSGREVFFTETPHKLFFGAKRTDIILTRSNMTAPTCKAYKCEACKKVIVAYE